MPNKGKRSGKSPFGPSWKLVWEAPVQAIVTHSNTKMATNGFKYMRIRTELPINCLVTVPDILGRNEFLYLIRRLIRNEFSFMVPKNGVEGPGASLKMLFQSIPSTGGSEIWVRKFSITAAGDLGVCISNE